MQRRHLLLACPMLLGACVPEGRPQTGNAAASPPGAGGFDWRAALAEERRAAALLLDPDRAWGLLPPAVREAAARAFPAGEGLGISGLYQSSSYRQRVLPAGGLVYVSQEQRRIDWEARDRQIAAGRIGEAPTLEDMVGTDFSIGPAALGFDLLRVDLSTHRIRPSLVPASNPDAERRSRPAYVTIAIDRAEGRLDLSRVGSSLLLESRRQPFSRETLGPAGPETRRIDRWQVVETVEESVVWREVLYGQRHWVRAAVEQPNVTASRPHLRGQHVRISHESDGQAAGTELHSRLFGIGRDRLRLRDEWGLSYTLNEAGRERLRAILAEEAQLYAEAPRRARQVAEADRGRARALFQPAFGLWQAGNFAAAQRGFEDGLKIDPWNGAAHFYMHDIFRNRVDTSQTGAVAQVNRSQAAALLADRHLRLAAALLPPDSREGIEARTMLSAT
jgi:hypothetical protein